MGFIPVAVHFELFQTLVKLGRLVTPAEVVEAVARNGNVKSPLSKSFTRNSFGKKLIYLDVDLQLAGDSLLLISYNCVDRPLREDTLFIIAGYGLWDSVDDKHQPNALTNHMVAHPSSIHGALHL